MLGRTTNGRNVSLTQCVYRSLGNSSPERGFTLCSANKPFSEPSSKCIPFLQQSHLLSILVAPQYPQIHVLSVTRAMVSIGR